jgi:hypothetical protein
MTNRDMKLELLERASDQYWNLRATLNALDSVDRLGDYDLMDQSSTADTLMTNLADLLERMVAVTG